ncbi:MAG: VacJ family lipoprotein [Pseudomonadales bacterium]|nr:VacJ family lipoprotein [Pseudomonadales bacterium]
MKHLIFVLFVVVCSQAYGDETDARNPDPWIGLNKRVYAFNEVADKWVTKPIAKGYRAVLPRFVRAGVNNFFENLGDVGNSLNNILQGKVGAGASDIGRIVINTTLGIGGVLDPASDMGLKKHNEDFGQTLQVWGLPRGPYLVIPFLGPSTVTDASGRPLDITLSPVGQLDPVADRNVLRAVSLINDRYQLLSAEKLVFGDKYLFYRDAYLQRREYLVKDGQVKDEFGDDF